MRWVRILAACIIALVLVFRARACAKEYIQSSPPERGSVRDELNQLQQRTGLTLASFDVSSILFVKFAHRGIEWQGDFGRLVGYSSPSAISPDGKQVALAFPYGPHFGDSDFAVVRLDGGQFRKYPMPGLTNDICWSSDVSQLALAEAFPVNPEVEWPAKRGPLLVGPIQILNRTSGTLQKAFDGSYLTSQCWSPDGGHIVIKQTKSSRAVPRKQAARFISMTLRKRNRIDWRKEACLVGRQTDNGSLSSTMMLTTRSIRLAKEKKYSST
jgi:hypothetical protein